MRTKRPVHQSAPASNATLKYLTPAQVDTLVAAAREHSRYPARDAALILLAYHHGLRVSELCGLTWADINLAEGTMQVRRGKAGAPAVHPLARGDRGLLTALERAKAGAVFTNERGQPVTPAGVQMLLRRICERAGLPHVHPHMLRHAAGYKLVNQGTDLRTIQAYLGHRAIESTVRYTEIDARRFKGLF